MGNTEELQDKFLDDLWDFFEEVPNEDKFIFANQLIHVALECGCDSHIEKMGTLQCVILDKHDEFNEYLKEKRKKGKKK